MKTIIAILLCSVLGYGETLIEALTANPGTKDSGFLASKTNRLLMASDMMARLNDAISTARLPERGCHEVQIPIVASHHWSMVGYSVGLSVVLDITANQLWKHGHRRLARTLLLGDTALDGGTGVRNWMIHGKTTSR
jgi:hypothetical protein